MAVIEFKRLASPQVETQSRDVKNKNQGWENHELQESLFIDNVDITLSYVLIKKIIANQLAQLMEAHQISKIQMAQRMGISGDNLDRILSPQEEDNSTLATLAWCAKYLGHSLELKLN